MTNVPTITLNDGHTIPQLGFGVWQVSTEDIVPAVRKALEVGYRHIDTAAIYGNEEGVGQAIKESGIPRDQLFVTTKLWNDRHGDVRAAITESLGKLGLDYLDLYLTHWPVPQQNKYLDAWLAMEEAQRDGLTRSIGVSNHQREHLELILDKGTVTPAVNQIEVHPTLTQDAMVDFDKSKGIVTEAWSPLGQAKDLENPVITELAEQLGRTPAQVILRWHLQRGLVVFPKSVTPKRIEENFDVFGFELDDAAMQKIAGLDDSNRIGPDPDTFNVGA
ncbi:2,5-diketo-D-gluconate reductase A [Propionibacteriaceae bacterium ES.041]|uniref:aldo/keto reductase n=1 Tax=Enemella evansiae TaxID=2016499 RepID=UPI000B96A2EC|nr:aldo/keto reductase [Enemella evansiae]OYO00659.1 oxidoreductase [Enemella evansiae]OYO11937.1 oxidoreductase [Enemella evansiae]OYO17121.1 oxidoreductase [Enemella evansiae]PFG68985.1 2,5-diketo-D-gluconate reductase A [Propionibacteriaceae bacterium ES.041]